MELGFTDALGIEWDNYISFLRNIGICLNSAKDCLFWSKNTKDASITAAKAYDVACNQDFTGLVPNWFVQAWKWNLTLKVLLFCWLLIANKVLTWDSLLRRGFYGTSVCLLCFSDAETATHLMINCPFTKQVWDFVYSSLNLDVTWHGDSVKEAFTLWSSEAKSWHIIPFFVCRSLWLTRNAFIFEGKTFTPLQVFKRLDVSG